MFKVFRCSPLPPRWTFTGIVAGIEAILLWLGFSYRYFDFQNPSLPRNRGFSCRRRYVFAVFNSSPHLHAQLSASTTHDAPTSVLSYAHGPRTLRYRYPNALLRRYTNFRIIFPITPPFTMFIRRKWTFVLMAG